MITKICGIKKVDTLLLCESKKVDLFGMIFYPKSPRNISVNTAKKLQEISKNLSISGVGVFVDKTINDITDIIQNIDLEYVQLHGNENNDF